MFYYLDVKAFGHAEAHRLAVSSFVGFFLSWS